MFRRLGRSKVLQSAVRGLYADYKKNVLRAQVRFIELLDQAINLDYPMPVEKEGKE